ncbi:MAG TPA: phage portal protein [Anaerolineaceae bacterium]|jgi:HK97 family phage portal protein|nr:phage portal protein [Anaerolineaceae bacterium]
MTTIISQTNLVDMPANWWPASGSRSLTLYDSYSYDYSTLYKTQPNVRVCVDFLARNIAQLGLHVYRRLENDDRVRVRDHGIAKLLDLPLPASYKVTQYRLLESLMGDLGVYHNAFWLKLRNETGFYGLLRIPPVYVTVSGSLYPTGYTITYADGPRKYDPLDIVHFRGYNAENAVSGLSPLETLRRILAEEQASGDYREHFWGNAARMAGVIERPATAPEWSDTARQRFKSEFSELYAGGDNSGKTAVLEEGMQWKAISFNPQEAEYLSGRKLTREECARAYHIPPPLVGILDHATFSNITEQHKNLFTDVLGPWCESIEQEIALQVLPEFADQDGVYVEFNIQEKLQGDFQTQTQSLQSAIGRPWMTANEGRARMNLPRMDGGDELVTPLNVISGGQASPNDVDGKANPTLTQSIFPSPNLSHRERNKQERVKELEEEEEVEVFRMYDPKLRGVFEAKWEALLINIFERQKKAVMSKVGGKMAPHTPSLPLTPALSRRERGIQGEEQKEGEDINLIWDYERWNEEVAKDFTKLTWETIRAWAEKLAAALGITLNEEVMRIYVENNVRIAAENLNMSTYEQVDEALRSNDVLAALESVFALALGVRTIRFASGRVTSLSNYGAYSAGRQGGAMMKRWIVTSKNPRETHMSMDGETVGIREKFSNGLRWPGDSLGMADETVNCRCVLEYLR